MSTEGAGSTRGGGEGLHNEDAFLVEEGLGLYVVCDGVSDTPAGEVAARAASRAVEDFVERSSERIELRSAIASRAVVERAMSYAMAAVDEAEREDPALRGLDTTLTLLLVHGHHGVIGHRGDSRAYLIRRGRTRQLTVDDELTEDVSNGGGVLGADVFALRLESGDTVVLCTDGAERAVIDAEIGRVASTLSPRVLASRIVSAAHAEAPDEDATAVVVRVRAEREPGWLELSRPTRETAYGHTLQFA